MREKISKRSKFLKDLWISTKYRHSLLNLGNFSRGLFRVSSRSREIWQFFSTCHGKKKKFLSHLSLPFLSPFHDTLPRTRENRQSRGTNSEIELRVSFKNPYRSLFSLSSWRGARRRGGGDPAISNPAGSRVRDIRLRSLNYSTHSRAPCGNSSPPTSLRVEHHPRLKEQ